MAVTRRPSSYLLALAAMLLTLAVAAPAARADDLVAPTDTTTVPAAGPGGWYADAPVSVTLSATDDDSGVAGVEYTLDGGDPVVVDAGTSLDISGDGTHVLVHRAQDLAGNWSEAVTATISIDVTAPADTTTAPPADANGWYRSTAVAVTLTAADGGSGPDAVEYRIDAGDPQSAAPGTDVTLAGEGTHTLEHRVRDVAGTWSDWATTTVRIDSVAPANTTAPVDASWRRTDAVVAVTGTDGTSGVERVEYTIDGATPVRTGSPTATATVTGDGSHTLQTRVVDQAGNAGAWRSDTVRIDSAAPTDTTTVLSGWRHGPQTVAVAGSDPLSGIQHVEWQLDGGSVQTATGASAAVDVAAEGEHALRTRVVDVAGNASAWTDRVVRNDSTAPTNLTPVAPTAWRSSDYAVRVDASDGGSGVDRIEYRIDGAPARSTPPGTTVQVTGNGTHQLLTRAVDLADNASAWRQDDVAIDGLAPDDSTAAPPTGAVPNPYTLAITGTDAHSGVDHVEWQVDGGTPNTGPAGSPATASGDGPHVIRERIVDRAGNASPWQDRTVTVDTGLNGDSTAPTDSTTGVPPGWSIGPVTVTVKGTDAGSGLKRMDWRLDGRPIASGPSPTPVTITGDGVHTLETRAVDQAANASGWTTHTVRIDTTVPTDTTPAPSGWSASRSVAVKGTDAGSGVATVEWSLDGGATRSGPPGSTVTVPSDGEHDLVHRIVDRVGQASPWVTSALKIDTVAPVDRTPALPRAWQAAAVTRALTGTDAGSGIDHMEFSLDGAAPQPGPLHVAADGVHAVRTRAVDHAGNVSPWRADTVRVDVTAPRNTTPAAPAAWLTSPYRVTVAADDGHGSGVAKLQWRIGDRGAISEDPQAVVDADGASLLETRAVDDAGHASPWRVDTVRIDRAAPAAGLRCTPRAAPTGYDCAATGADGISGVATVAYRVGDRAWHAPAADGGFAVDAGRVQVLVTDGAGLTTLSAPLVLDARLRTTTRTRSLPVSLRGAKGTRGLLGALELRVERDSRGRAVATADLRPLAVGRGRYRTTLRLTSGGLGAKRRRTVTLKRGGHTPRLGLALSRVRRPATVRLTVERRAGRRWRTVATAKATVKLPTRPPQGG